MIIDDKRLQAYRYRVEWVESDEQYVATCGKFPGLSWLENTPSEAVDGFCYMLVDVLDDMAKNGEKVPE